MAFNEDLSVFYDTDEFAASAVYSHNNFTTKVNVFVNKDVETIGDNGVYPEKITAIECPSSLEVSIDGEFHTQGKCYVVDAMPLSDDGVVQVIPVREP